MRTPVIIPAHNESSLIGKTLSALPKNDVEPLVALNGSTDDTAEVAQSFGAKVFSFDEQGKLPAIQAVLKRLGSKALDPLMILDADTRPIMPRRWHRSMLELLVEKAPAKPTVVGGPIWFNDTSVVNSALNSLWLLYRASQESDDDHDQEIYQAGPNMGLKIQSENVLEQILELPHLWPGEDRALVRTIQTAGGVYFHPHSPNLYALTRMHVSWPTISKRLFMTRDQSTQWATQGYRERAAEGSQPYWL